MAWSLRRGAAPTAFSAAAFCLFAALPTAAQWSEQARLPLWVALPAAALPMRSPIGDAGGGAGWTVRASAANFEAADATPVRAFSGDWQRYTPRDGRNVALQFARIEVGAVRQHWELTALLRSEVLVTGSRGAFDAVRAYKQRLTPADGSEFALAAEETGVVLAGLRVARTWVLRPGSEQGLQLTGALTWLSVRRLQWQGASGQVWYSGATGYRIDAQTLQHDSQQQFGGYGRQDARGAGYSADLGLWWRPSTATFVNLSATDLVSKLTVNGVSTQQTTLSSSTASFDANGYVEYRPLLVGRYATADLNLKLSRKWSASVGTRLAWRDGQMWVGARWERVADLGLPALWTAVPVAPGWLLQLDGETRFRSVGVGLVSRYGELMLRTRSLPAGQSRALGWRVAFNLPL